MQNEYFEKLQLDLVHYLSAHHCEEDQHHKQNVNLDQDLSRENQHKHINLQQPVPNQFKVAEVVAYNTLVLFQG